MADIEARIRVKDDMSPALKGIVNKVNTVLSKLDAVVTGTGKVTRGFSSADHAAENLQRTISLTSKDAANIVHYNDRIAELTQKIQDKHDQIAKKTEQIDNANARIGRNTRQIADSTRIISKHYETNNNRLEQIRKKEKQIESLKSKEVVDHERIRSLNQDIVILKGKIKTTNGYIQAHNEKIAKSESIIEETNERLVTLADEKNRLTLRLNTLKSRKLTFEEAILAITQRQIAADDKAAAAEQKQLEIEKQREAEAARLAEYAQRDVALADQYESTLNQVNAELQKSELLLDQMTASVDRTNKIEMEQLGYAKKIVDERKRIASTVERQFSNQSKLLNLEQKGITSGFRVSILKKQIERDNRLIERSQSKILNYEKQIEAATNRTAAAQNKSAQGAKNRASAAGGVMWGKVKMIGGAYLGTQGALSILGTADALAANEARLNLMVKEGETAEQLGNKIYEAAMRSRVGYLDMADSVAKVGIQAGNLFDNNDQMVRFMETFSKMAIISKSTTQQTNSAMTQLIQALSFGQLRGDELKSILENMPMVAQVIADEMTRMGNFGDLPKKLKSIAADGKVTADEIRALGYEGQISAETVINAMLNGSKKVDEMAKNMTWTWAQVWTVFKSYALKAFTPVLQGISKIIQTERFQRFATWVGNLLAKTAAVIQQLWQPVGNVLAWVFDKVAAIGNFISNNWSMIAPIVLGIATAMAAYRVALIGVALWQGICGAATAALTFAKGVHAAATAMATGATLAETAAQYGLNTAMYACPLTWIILLIIALIALIYLVVAAINEWCGTTISATGIIAGAIAWLGALIWDIIAAVWNYVMWLLDAILTPIIDACEWIYNAFNGGFTGWMGAVENAFWKFVRNIWEKIKPLVEVFDFFNGSNYATKMSSLIENKITSTQGSNYKKFDRNILQKNLSAGFVNPNDAYKAGYNWGEGIENKISSFGDIGKITDPTKGSSGYENDLIKALQNGFNDPNAASNPALNKIGGNTDKIAKNTGSAADSLESNAEDTKYLRELAHREAINKYTLTDLNVNMTNNNSIASNVDVDSVAHRIYGALADLAGGTHGKRYSVNPAR